MLQQDQRELYNRHLFDPLANNSPQHVTTGSNGTIYQIYDPLASNLTCYHMTKWNYIPDMSPLVQQFSMLPQNQRELYARHLTPWQQFSMLPQNQRELYARHLTPWQQFNMLPHDQRKLYTRYLTP